MVLGASEISELIQNEKLIINFDKDNIQAASYDLRNLCVDNRYADNIVKPGEFRLVSTCEKVHLPGDVAAFLKTKSSLARIGVCAGDIGGWFDPGYTGDVTIAVYNFGDRDLDLKEIKSTTQMVFLEVKGDGDNLYEGHYQNSNGVVHSILSDKRYNSNHLIA